MRIGIDLMGGDFAPLEPIKGIANFFQHNHSAVELFCIGNPTQVAPLIETYHLSDKIHFIPAEEIIGYNEHPTKALKEKPNSSLAIGFGMLAAGKIDAFISAGNTGAMLVGTMFSIKTIQGVARPTIGTVIPQLDGGVAFLLDAGLNTDCKPEFLAQFAILGTVFAETILGISNPNVGLINIGEEAAKGNALAQAAYPLLQNNASIQFLGNVETRDLFKSKVNVMVCDGFVGNIILKMAEAFYAIAQQQGFDKSAYIQRFNFENYGGTPILGVTKPVIIGHGISSAKAFENMLMLAQKMLQTECCKKIQEKFENLI